MTTFEHFDTNAVYEIHTVDGYTTGMVVIHVDDRHAEDPRSTSVKGYEATVSRIHDGGFEDMDTNGERRRLRVRPQTWQWRTDHIVGKRHVGGLIPGRWDEVTVDHTIADDKIFDGLEAHDEGDFDVRGEA